MSSINVVVEYNNDNWPIIRHDVIMPDFNEDEYYIQSISFGAFTRRMSEFCCKNRRLLYYYRDEESIRFEEDGRARLIEQYGDKFREFKIPSELPGVSHENVWEFYKYIGYDYKKKKLQKK